MKTEIEFLHEIVKHVEALRILGDANWKKDKAHFIEKTIEDRMRALERERAKNVTK